MPNASSSKRLSARARDNEHRRSMALAVSGLDIPVEIRRHSAARRMTLRVHQARRVVIVTVPLRCNLAEAGRFVASHVDWVKSRIGALPVAVGFVDGALMPVRGTICRLKFVGTAERGPVVSINQVDGAFSVLAVRGDPVHASRRLKDWLYSEARQDLDARVRYHADRLGLRPKKLSVRDQGSRWGSCSSAGALSFSWRLILAPPDVLDYVAAHEVAHLGEMNHGPRFWALVEQTLPNMEMQRQWLRLHGLDLHRYAPR